MVYIKFQFTFNIKRNLYINIRHIELPHFNSPILINRMIQQDLYDIFFVLKMVAVMV